MRLPSCIALAAIVAVASSTASRGADWPVFGHDPARTGVDAGGRIINRSNVHRLRVRWQISLEAVADSTPIFLERVRAGARLRSMLFQTDKHGVTYGIDAVSGRVRWRFRTHGPDITTSTPAADPSGAAIYVPGVDGMVHEVEASTGREVGAVFRHVSPAWCKPKKTRRRSTSPTVFSMRRRRDI